MEKVDKEKEEREKKSLEEHARRSKLFKDNRFMFEVERKKEIEALIKSAAPEHQKKLKEIQAEWDHTMKGAGNKHNRLILAEHMLMDHFQRAFVPAVNNAAEKKAE